MHMYGHACIQLCTSAHAHVAMQLCSALHSCTRMCTALLIQVRTRLLTPEQEQPRSVMGTDGAAPSLPTQEGFGVGNPLWGCARAGVSSPDHGLCAVLA